MNYLIAHILAEPGHPGREETPAEHADRLAGYLSNFWTGHAVSLLGDLPGYTSLSTYGPGVIVWQSGNLHPDHARPFADGVARHLGMWDALAYLGLVQGEDLDMVRGVPLLWEELEQGRRAPSWGVGHVLAVGHDRDTCPARECVERRQALAFGREVGA